MQEAQDKRVQSLLGMATCSSIFAKLPRATAMRPLSRQGKRKLMDFQAGALPKSISTPRKESGSLCPYVACVATHRGVSIGAKNVPERGGSLLGARVRHSAHGKGNEEGGSTYAKAGSSLRSLWDARRTRRPFPSAPGAAPHTTGAEQVWSPLLSCWRWRGGMGTPSPGSTLACVWSPLWETWGSFPHWT